MRWLRHGRSNPGHSLGLAAGAREGPGSAPFSECARYCLAVKLFARAMGQLCALAEEWVCDADADAEPRENARGARQLQQARRRRSVLRRRPGGALVCVLVLLVACCLGCDLGWHH